MAYTNIYWIKLHVELLHDKRFMFDCNDEQKWMFIGLLLIAANTKNEIPYDMEYLKNRLNLEYDEAKIKENVEFIASKFDGFTIRNGFIKFKNFNKIHNYLYKERENSQRILEEVPENSLKHVTKEKLDTVLDKFIEIKSYPIFQQDGEKDQNLIAYLYKRNGKVIKELLILAKGNVDKIIESIEWLEKLCAKKNLNWTLETVLKWYPDYMVKGASIQSVPESLKKYL